MKIMMYYDGTKDAKEALPIVMEHAKTFQAQVDVVSSLPKGNEAQLEEIEKREDGLADIKRALDSESIPCETHLLIRGRDAGEDIVDFAKQHEVKEIIIGTKKRSLFDRLFAGWMANRVLGSATCPVVLV